MSSNPPNFRTDIYRGEIYWVDWSPGRGSEQTGVLPGLIVQTDQGNTNARYNNTIVLAISRQGSQRILTHVYLEPTAENGLTDPSYVKSEQILTISKDRILARIGKLTDEDMADVDTAIKRALSL